MTDIDKLRSSLERNKVFFETIAAFTLTIMAVIISIVQIGMAARQNELIELQVQVERQQAIPQLILETSFDFSEGPDGQPLANTEKIVVTNHGGTARAISGDVYVFMDVYLDGEINSFPIIGYYWTIAHTGNGIGKVLEISGYDNNTKFVDLKRGFSDLAKAQGQMGWIDLTRIVRLSYQDVFGDTHIEYYRVVPITGGRLISESEGAAYKQQVDRYFEETGTVWPDLDDLRPEDITSLMVP